MASPKRLLGLIAIGLGREPGEQASHAVVVCELLLLIAAVCSAWR